MNILKNTAIAIAAIAATVVVLTGCGAGREQALSQPDEAQQSQPKEGQSNEAQQSRPGKEPSKSTPQSTSPKSTQEPMRVVAYLPVAGQAPSADTLAKLTDIVLIGGIAWDEQGEIVIAHQNYLPIIEQIKSTDSDVKVWSTVYPKGSMIRNGTVGQSIDTPEDRAALCRYLTEHAADNELDGIDIDFEFPKDKAEWDYFGSLAVELAPLLQKDGRQLSLALYPKDIELSKEALQSVNYVNIMAYDMFDEQGRHSTYDTAKDSITYFTELGAQPSQLTLGLPLYGRPTDQSSRWDLYNTLPTIGDSTCNVYGDSYYNGTELLGKKVELAGQAGLSGVMIYHLGCDLPVSEPLSAVAFISEKAGETEQ